MSKAHAPSGAKDGAHQTAPVGAHAADHSEAHEGPIKTPRQLIWAVALSFIVPILLIYMLVNFVASGTKPAAGTTALADEAVALRIAPVARVVLKDASSPAALKNGEQVFQAQCAACHVSGAAGAPKLGDTAGWAARIKTGYEALLGSALKGKGAMAAQGGGDHSDLEIGRAVVYMANQGGAKFDEPKAAGAAAAASAPAADMAAAAPAAAPAAAVALADSRVEASAGLVKLFFASGKAELPTDAKDALGKLAEEIKTGGKSAVISGFHDAKGSATANAELAKQRAFSARDLLLAAGVAQDKITLEKPASTTGDGDAAQARRVEIAVK